mgnify:CR=1 FL=1
MCIRDRSGTMRNFVYGKEIAVNGIKILPDSNDEPSYVGTAYVDLQDIEVLDERFNNLWDMAKPWVDAHNQKKETAKKDN